MGEPREREVAKGIGLAVGEREREREGLCEGESIISWGTHALSSLLFI